MGNRIPFNSDVKCYYSITEKCIRERHRIPLLLLKLCMFKIWFYRRLPHLMTQVHKPRSVQSFNLLPNLSVEWDEQKDWTWSTRITSVSHGWDRPEILISRCFFSSRQMELHSLWLDVFFCVVPHGESCFSMKDFLLCTVERCFQQIPGMIRGWQLCN